MCITKLMNCGDTATIIRYGNARDIDVQFSDGTILTHKKYGDFKRGLIRNPNIKRTPYLNATKLMNCGLKATVIVFRNSFDIDVQFETGDIVQHKCMSNFTSGKLSLPNYRKQQKNQLHKGETQVMNSGLTATLIEYRNNEDIDVQFEDGTIVKHRKYDGFLHGSILHPTFSRLGIEFVYKDLICKRLTRISRFSNNTYYNCRCQKCDFTGILTAQEILTHVCE